MRSNIIRWIAVLVVLTVCTSPTLAEGHRYLKGVAGIGSHDGGALNVSDPDRSDGRADPSYGDTVAYGVAFGWDAQRISYEIDYLFRAADFDGVTFVDGTSIDGGDVASETISGNLYFRFRPDRRWQPYLGAGIAYIREIDADFEDGGRETSYQSDDFAGQVMGGFRYGGDKWLFDAQLRWLVVNDIFLEDDNSPGVVVADYQPIDLLVSFGFRF